MGAARNTPSTNLPEVLVFGGTTEGREIAEWLGSRGSCTVYISSLTEYGGSLVNGLPHVHALTGRMLPEQMETLMREHAFSCVIDATHPYAVGVSANIAACAEDCGLSLYRVLREGEPEGPWTGFDTAAQAAVYVAKRPGKVLLTTGSKDLAVYVAAISDYRERLYVRILPMASSIAAADELGIPASHIVAMQGPFSRELNKALLREFDIGIMVTKASGAAGGFWEKVEAAGECGVELVVIHRPVETEGYSLYRVKQMLTSVHGL
ncbi:MAG: precorrin-6A reductase [Coriobacteriaceae bacterium]|nr:precorrin-6A reductase [Coriobacteriaceae bacterium]